MSASQEEARSMESDSYDVYRKWINNKQIINLKSSVINSARHCKVCQHSIWGKEQHNKKYRNFEFKHSVVLHGLIRQRN